MAQNASRRSLLASLVALPAVSVGTAPTLAADADAELFAALARYHEADRASGLTDETLDAAYLRYRDEFGGTPPFPDALWVRETDRELTLFSSQVDHSSGRAYFGETTIEHLRRSPRARWAEEPHPTLPPPNVRGVLVPWPKAQARAEEIIAAWDTYRSEARRRREASGLAAAELANDLALAAYQEAQRALYLTPARTMPGMLAKAAVVMGPYDEAETDFVEEMDDSQATFNFKLSMSLARDVHKLAREG